MSTLIRQRALQTWVLSICIIAVLLSLIFLHWNNAFYLHSLLKFYSKQKFLWFCHLVVYQHFTFFANSYPFYLVLLLKIKYRCSIPFTVMGKISRDCDKDVTSGKSWNAFWENLWTKAGPHRASIDSSEKRIMLDYQLSFKGQGRTYDFLWKFRATMRRTREDTRGPS